MPIRYRISDRLSICRPVSAPPEAPAEILSVAVFIYVGLGKSRRAGEGLRSGGITEGSFVFWSQHCLCVLRLITAFQKSRCSGGRHRLTDYLPEAGTEHIASQSSLQSYLGRTLRQQPCILCSSTLFRNEARRMTSSIGKSASLNGFGWA